MKKARALLNKAGLPIYLTVILFSIVKLLIIQPVMGLIWRFSLMTTPEGYISNANIGITLLKSPWIVVIGIILLGIYILFSMWQISATVLGVGYAYKNQSPKVLELLAVSVKDVLHGTRAKNIMLVVYTVIILPFTNSFQASEMIGTFVVPEYIRDFIDSNTFLVITYFVIFILASYLALRWLYLIPAFFLKSRDFKTASEESFAYSEKKTIKNFVRLLIYVFIEFVRLAILPLVIFVILGVAAYLCVYRQQYALELTNLIIIKMSRAFYEIICSVMIYLSTMCFVVEEYIDCCEKADNVDDIVLPELKREGRFHMSGQLIQISASLLSGVFIAATYLLIVFAVNMDPEIMNDLIYDPLVIAHKGYSSKAPENTMNAFKLADETDSVDYIELDVWSSKDGVPVVLHNESIKAATGLAGNIYDYTYEELQNIPAPYAMDKEKFKDARIPSLEEVIQEYSESTPLIIEIKGYKKDDQLPAKIVALMEKYNCTETSMIHSGNYAALKAVKECNPDIRCGLIQAIVTGNSYDLPYADFLSVEHTFINQTMIDQLHLRGKEVYAWTVNYSESVNALRSMEVDGFITDYPDDVANEVKSDLEIKDMLEAQMIDEPDSLSESDYEAGDY